LLKNSYGQYDGIIGLLSSSLGNEGLEYLKKKIILLSKEKVPRPSEKDRIKVGIGSRGSIYEDEISESSRKEAVKSALRAIADAQGDADAFIAQYDKKTRKVPIVAAEIAERLLASNRSEEALKAIEAAEHRDKDWVIFEWEDARIKVLEVLGRVDDAQNARWSCFEKSLSIEHLRGYLRKLSDFEDEEAQKRAFDYVQSVEEYHSALAFFISWPALDRAARLVFERSRELDGNIYELLTVAAEKLAGKYPLAAILLLRTMIDYSLKNAKTTRYRHAARHLMDCSSLSVSISDFKKFESHKVFLDRLKKEHGKKLGFWSLLD
jgi:tetratricopeptide (TPR) repeat protein